MLVVSSVHNLSVQAVRYVAVAVFQQRLSFPTKFLQVSLVPTYCEQDSVDAMQPLPLVTHPVKNFAQSASVVESWLSVQTLIEH